VPKILYKARNAQGDEVAGYADAATAAAAVAQLKASGLRDIELHESPGIAAAHAGRVDADARQAAFHLRLRERPGLGTVLAELARRERGTLAFEAVAVVAGVALHRPWLAAIGVAALAATFGLPVWRHRHARRFRRFQLAMAHGHWREARALFERLRRDAHEPAVEMQWPIHDAQLRVREGEPLAQVLARIEPSRQQFAPGQFDARVASIHAAAQDHDGFIARMRAAWEASPDDPSRLTDYALANARVGDLALADELLARIDVQALEVHGRPFVWWARGLVELRNDRPGALASLQQGVDGFLRIASPAALGSLALCSGACALAMQRAGDAAGAKAMVARVWPLLKVHADTRLRAEIEREVGTP
jgi:hypothetical protein